MATARNTPATDNGGGGVQGTTPPTPETIPTATPAVEMAPESFSTVTINLGKVGETGFVTSAQNAGAVGQATVTSAQNAGAVGQGGENAITAGAIATVEQISVAYVPPEPTKQPIPIPDNVSALNQRGDQDQDGGETKAESDAAGESADGASGAEAAAGQFSNVLFASLLAAIVERCAADKAATSDSMAALKKSRTDLADGTTTNAQAGATILAAVQYLKVQPPEIIKKTVESLTAVKKDKLVKQKYGARAQANLALPFTLHGYTGMSGGHVSKMATIVRYADTRGVKPDEFGEFLDEHDGGKGGGFKNTYIAAKAFFSPDKETAEEKTERHREAVAEMLKQQPTIGTIDVPISMPANIDGFLCFVGIRGKDGKVRVISPVPNKTGTLFESIYDSFPAGTDGKPAPISTGRARDQIKAAAKSATVSAPA
ncbi:MAG: hypothetical protein WCJ64_10735 [Rhodospirillaceae bacterium]